MLGNLAGRMGRRSARHRKTAVFGWLTWALVLPVVRQLLGDRN